MRSFVHGLLLVLAPAALTAQRPPLSPGSSPRLDVRQVSLGKPLEGIRWDSLTLSPDGKRVAYAVTKGPSKASYLLVMAYMAGVGSAWVVVDGVRGPKYQGVSSLIFSADGTRVAYRAMRGAKLETMGGLLGKVQEMIVVDGVEGPAFLSATGGVGRPAFSPDGSKVAYRARRGKEAVVVIDGREGEVFDVVSDPVFRPDGTGVAYLAARAKTLYLVNGGEVTATGFDQFPRELYDSFSTTAPPLVMSPDGRRIAYRARRDKKWFMVVDGRAAGPYDESATPVFTADGKLAYTARRDKTNLIVTEEVETPLPYERLGSPVFSPDGRRVAYWARIGRKEHLIVDGVPSAPHQEYSSRGDDVFFSPDGRHLAYLAVGKKRRRPVVDGVEGPEYENPKGWVYVDGRFFFDAPDGLSHVGRVGDEIVRWEIRIVEPPAPSPEN